MTTADAFLAQKEKFQLGDLPTESPHPKTMQLSDWAKADVGQGLRVLREVDLDALRRIAEAAPELDRFFHDVAATLEAWRPHLPRGLRRHRPAVAVARLSVAAKFPTPISCAR